MYLNRNGLLGGMRYRKWEYSGSGVAEHFSKAIAGDYRTTDYVNLRTGGSTDYHVITTIPKNTVVECYGYYHLEKETVWLYVLVRTETKNMLGFMCSTYLERI